MNELIEHCMYESGLNLVMTGMMTLVIHSLKVSFFNV
jgi:hypothetical protein